MYQARLPRRYPPAWRIWLGFLVAPAVGALIMGLLAPAYDGLPTFGERLIATVKIYALIGAYPTALLFGVPAYFMARRHFPARPLPCAFVGGVVAALPWMILALISPASSASIGGRATIIDGHYTAYGWLTNAGFVGQIALVGSAAGLIFWAISAAGFEQVRHGD